MPAGDESTGPVQSVQFRVQCGHCDAVLNDIEVPAADEVLTEAKWRGVSLSCPACHKTCGPKITKTRHHATAAPAPTPA